MSDRCAAGGTVEFENAHCIAASEKAILVQLEDREQPVWVPQSQVHEDSEVWKPGQTGTLVLTEWIAHEKGLI